MTFLSRHFKNRHQTLTIDKKDIKNFTLPELEKIFIPLEEPSYRAKQVFSWLYEKGVDSFSGMKNLPGKLIDKLDKLYYIGGLNLNKRLRAKDGTEKFLFKLKDGNFIESVFIPASRRNTLCLSTQVGCKFGCAFCASGLTGFIRDLTASEIISQVLFLEHHLKYKITNYVFMGMGEPLDNYINTFKAISIMNTSEGLNIGSRRITISTCGLVPAMDKLKDLALQVNLSLSLHAADDKLRDELVPVNRKYPLGSLLKAGEKYMEESGRMITLEYVLIKGKNDTFKDADNLAAIAQRLKAKVNLIAYNKVSAFKLEPPTLKDLTIFMNRLRDKKVNVTLRKSKGADIQAACGQLAGGRNVKI